MTEPIDTTFDPDAVPDTTHFRLTRIGDGEGLDKNGWATLDADRIKIDDVLWALSNHKHTGEPALGNPSDEPTLDLVTTGGHLQASTTYYYRIAYIDRWGLESGASPEASLTTADPIDDPTAPASTVETASGNVEAGTYSYVISCIDGYGGETNASDSNDVVVDSGSTNRIRLDLPDLPDEAVAFNIYRSRPGQTRYYFVASTVGASWYDTGVPEDQTINAPIENTTLSSNSVQVTIPAGFVPQRCVAWRIYRATASGAYDGNSLVHEVSEGASDVDQTPRTVWLDTGDAMAAGYPKDTSSTIAMPSVIDLGEIQGSLPIGALPRGAQNISATAADLTDGAVVTVTETIAPIRPTRLTAHLQTPPAAGTAVTFEVADSAGHSVQLRCAADTARAGDPAGYYRLAFPASAAGTYQAENGTLSNAAVEIVTDLAAVSGQAVNLDAANEWVQAELGQLDEGQYTSSISVRVAAYGQASDGDLVVAAVRTDTDAVLASTALSMNDTSVLTYVDRAGPTFQAPGGVPIALRVRKANATVTEYNVDSVTIAPNVPTLAAGLITVRAHVDAGAGAAGANLALWF